MSRTSWILFWANLPFIPWNLYEGLDSNHWYSWAALAFSVLVCGYQIHTHRYIKRSRARRNPVAPRNVRIVNRDGTTIPMELVYDGWVDGCHQWHAVTPWKVSPGWEIRADVIPANTSIVMRTS